MLKTNNLCKLGQCDGFLLSVVGIATYSTDTKWSISRQHSTVCYCLCYQNSLQCFTALTVSWCHCLSVSLTLCWPVCPRFHLSPSMRLVVCPTNHQSKSMLRSSSLSVFLSVCSLHHHVCLSVTSLFLIIHSSVCLSIFHERCKLGSLGSTVIPPRSLGFVHLHVSSTKFSSPKCI